MKKRYKVLLGVSVFVLALLFFAGGLYSQVKFACMSTEEQIEAIIWHKSYCGTWG